MKPCKYFYQTDGLVVRIVDTKKNLKDSTKICQQFGEQLAPINNQKRLNDTLDHLKGCYETDVHGIPEEQKRNYHLYRIGLSVTNGTGSWSDGTSLNKSEQGSLFYKDAIPDQSTFFIEKRGVHRISYVQNNIKTIKLPFLCSKSNLFPPTTTTTAATTTPPTTTDLVKTTKFANCDSYTESNGKTDQLSVASSSADSYFMIATSLGFVLLLVIIGVLIYKLFKKNKSDEKRVKYSSIKESNQPNELVVDDAGYDNINIPAENIEPAYTEIQHPTESSHHDHSTSNQQVYSQPRSSNYKTIGGQPTDCLVNISSTYAVVDKSRKK